MSRRADANRWSTNTARAGRRDPSMCSHRTCWSSHDQHKPEHSSQRRHSGCTISGYNCSTPTHRPHGIHITLYLNRSRNLGPHQVQKEHQREQRPHQKEPHVRPLKVIEVSQAEQQTPGRHQRPAPLRQSQQPKDPHRQQRTQRQDRILRPASPIHAVKPRVHVHQRYEDHEHAGSRQPREHLPLHLCSTFISQTNTSQPTTKEYADKPTDRSAAGPS